MSEIIPLFYDHSCGRSILTAWSEKEATPGGPQSIVSLCKKSGLKQCFLVSNNFHTFLEAWKNLKSEGIQLCFGLELIFVEDAKIHTPESRYSEHKVLIFAKNYAGYKDLIKIYTACYSNLDNKYEIFRFDYKQLADFWTGNLIFVIPYWDSFLHRNKLGFNSNIIPTIPLNAVIFREVGSDLPFSSIIDESIDKFNHNKSYEEVKIKTIYYEKSDDFKSYMVFRAIKNRATFHAPNCEYLCSNKFSFEEWEKLTK